MLTTDGREFTFPEPGPEMFYLTCASHTNMRWVTKNPYERSIHFLGVQIDEDLHWTIECSCPFSDLRVLPFSSSE